MPDSPMQDLNNPVARQIVEGEPPGEIIEKLVIRGWRYDIARGYVEHLVKKYDLDHSEDRTPQRMLRTLLVRGMYTAMLVIVAAAICAVSLSMPPSVIGVSLFAIGVIVLSLGMVFILLK